MFLFVPVWIVDVKYPFCSLAAGLKWEDSERSSLILVISILKARYHQNHWQHRLHKSGLGISTGRWNKKCFSTFLCFCFGKSEKNTFSKAVVCQQTFFTWIRVVIYFCRNVELNKKKNKERECHNRGGFRYLSSNRRVAIGLLLCLHSYFLLSSLTSLHFFIYISRQNKWHSPWKTESPWLPFFCLHTHTHTRTSIPAHVQ